MIPELPIECWYIIFEYLDIPSLRQICLTSKYWGESSGIKGILKHHWRQNFLLSFPETLTSLEIFNQWTSPSNYPFKCMIEKKYHNIKRRPDTLIQLKFSKWPEKTGISQYASLETYPEIVNAIQNLETISNMATYGRTLANEFKTMARQALKVLTPAMASGYHVVDKCWTVYFLMRYGTVEIESGYGMEIDGIFDEKPAVKVILRSRGPFIKDTYLELDKELEFYEKVMEMHLLDEFPDGLTVTKWRLNLVEGLRLPRLAGSLIENDSDITKFIKTLAVCGYRAKLRRN